MDNRQTRQINEAARTFAEAVRESLRITSGRTEEAQERANRLTRSFFEAVTNELQAEVQSGRTISQQFLEQSRKQQETFRHMSGESMALYRDFLNSVSAYYRMSMERTPGSTRTAARATEETAAPAPAAAGGQPGAPIEGYDELNVRDAAGRLDGLSEAELRRVREYEVRNKNRRTLLDRIDQKLSQGS